MSNNNDADARDTAPVEPPARPADSDPGETPRAAAVASDAPVERDRRVSRGWLIAAVAAGGALLLALAFGGGIATGLGIAAVSRGDLVAEQRPGQAGPGHGGEERPGPEAGPGRERPEDARPDRQDGQSPTETPGPAPTPSS
ncbi:MAG TPA: hypothetical protein VFY91_01555 [Microbacterium sp.]|nr:hypothetical protein [Microbacterium sp.]